MIIPGFQVKVNEGAKGKSSLAVPPMRAKPCPPLSKAHFAKPCLLPLADSGSAPPLAVERQPTAIETIGDGPVTPQAPQEDRVAFARMPRGVTVGRPQGAPIARYRRSSIWSRRPQGAPIASSSVSEEPSGRAERKESKMDR